MLLVRWLRLPLALAIALGLTTPADAQLWKPTKKKPAAAVKAKSAPTARKLAKPTKRKPKAKPRARPRAGGQDDDPRVSGAGAEPDAVDDSPIITITDGDRD